MGGKVGAAEYWLAGSRRQLGGRASAVVQWPACAKVAFDLPERDGREPGTTTAHQRLMAEPDWVAGRTGHSVVRASGGYVSRITFSPAAACPSISVSLPDARKKSHPPRFEPKTGKPESQLSAQWCAHQSPHHPRALNTGSAPHMRPAEERAAGNGAARSAPF